MCWKPLFWLKLKFFSLLFSHKFYLYGSAEVCRGWCCIYLSLYNSNLTYFQIIVEHFGKSNLFWKILYFYWLWISITYFEIFNFPKLLQYLFSSLENKKPLLPSRGPGENWSGEATRTQGFAVEETRVDVTIGDENVQDQTTSRKERPIWMTESTIIPQDSIMVNNKIINIANHKRHFFFISCHTYMYHLSQVPYSYFTHLIYCCWMC